VTFFTQIWLNYLKRNCCDLRCDSGGGNSNPNKAEQNIGITEDVLNLHKEMVRDSLGKSVNEFCNLAR